MDTVGARAKAARNHLSLTRREVVARMGITRYATLVEIEEDRVNARVGVLVSLAAALETDLAWLVTGDAAHAPEWASHPGCPVVACDEADTDVTPSPERAA